MRSIPGVFLYDLDDLRAAAAYTAEHDDVAGSLLGMG